MKTRDGFVTNSSSSSFVVVMKKTVSDKELEDKISRLFGLSENHPLYRMARDISKKFVSELQTSEKFCEEDVEYVENEYSEEYVELLKEYGNIAIGWFGSDSDNAEGWLCENDLNYEDDDIIIKHDGGY